MEGQNTSTSKIFAKDNFEIDTMDFVILGAGLAGTMMARVLNDHYPDSKMIVIDQRESPDVRNHWALLRFRDLETARALGVAVKEIEVEKAVYYCGQLHHTANIAMNNMYSYKAYGRIASRSLKHLGITKRYLPVTTPRPVVGSVLWGTQLDAVRAGCIKVKQSSNYDPTFIYYKNCISTIPINALLQCLVGSGCNDMITMDMVKSEPIMVLRAKLQAGLECDVYQTIYFPESRFHTYRATLEGSDLIIEALGVPGKEGQEMVYRELPEVVRAFGLEYSSTVIKPLADSDFHYQPQGKIVDMNDDLRRNFIYQLTDQYNIYSVGRFATWRPLRADQLVKDVYKIERMIRQGGNRTLYERRLNTAADGE